MRLSILAAVAAFGPTVLAQGLLGSIPQCAQACFGNNLGSCGIADIACICGNTAVIDQVSCCVFSTCSQSDIAATTQFAVQLCKAGNINVNTAPTCPSGSSTLSGSPTASAGSVAASGSATPSRSAAASASASGSGASGSASRTPSATAAVSTGAASLQKAGSGLGLGIAVAGLLVAL